MDHHLSRPLKAVKTPRYCKPYKHEVENERRSTTISRQSATEQQGRGLAEASKLCYALLQSRLAHESKATTLSCASLGAFAAGHRRRASLGIAAKALSPALFALVSRVSAVSFVFLSPAA